MGKLWLVIMSLTLVLILGGPGCKKGQEETGVKMKGEVKKEAGIAKTEEGEMLRDTTVKRVD